MSAARVAAVAAREDRAVRIGEQHGRQRRDASAVETASSVVERLREAEAVLDDRVERAVGVALRHAERQEPLAVEGADTRSSTGST